MKPQYTPVPEGSLSRVPAFVELWEIRLCPLEGCDGNLRSETPRGMVVGLAWLLVCDTCKWWAAGS